jgi:hypothetical protein
VMVRVEGTAISGVRYNEFQEHLVPKGRSTSTMKTTEAYTDVHQAAAEFTDSTQTKKPEGPCQTQ